MIQLEVDRTVPTRAALGFGQVFCPSELTLLRNSIPWLLEREIERERKRAADRKNRRAKEQHTVAPAGGGG